MNALISVLVVEILILSVLIYLKKKYKVQKTIQPSISKKIIKNLKFPSIHNNSLTNRY